MCRGLLVGRRVVRVDQHEVAQGEILEKFVVVAHPRGLALHASRRGQLLSGRVRPVDDHDPIGKDAPRGEAVRGDNLD